MAADGEGDSAAREQALSETAVGCYRLIMARLAPTAQRWLKTLAKVTDAGGEYGSSGCSCSCGRDGLLALSFGEDADQHITALAGGLIANCRCYSEERSAGLHDDHVLTGPSRPSV